MFSCESVDSLNLAGSESKICIVLMHIVNRIGNYLFKNLLV